jgi:hypothetical protein
MAAAAFLMGIWLCAWPIWAQSDSSDPPSRSGLQWQAPRPESSQSGPTELDESPKADPANGRTGWTPVAQADGSGEQPAVVPATGAVQTSFQVPADQQPRRLSNRWADPGYANEPFDAGAGAEIDDDWLGDSCCSGQCNPGPCWLRDPYCGALAGRLWVRGEYLLWWTKGESLPPLVTTSPAGTAADVAGVLGQPGTSVLFGDSTANTSVHSGGRVTLGYWFDSSCHEVGIQASYLAMGSQSANFFAASPDTPIIARPYFDTSAGSQSALLVAYPGFLQGSISAEATTEFQAAELLLRRNLWQRPCDKLDFLIGWRYARLDESLDISQSSQVTAPAGVILPGTTQSLFDQFSTANEFNGVVLGLAYQEHICRWSLEALVKLGLGNTHSDVQIGGATTTTVPGAGSANFAGGLLAQQTNIGSYGQNGFAVIPEVGLTLGYDLTCRLRATVGYTFLYWSRVARPSDELDLNVSQLPPERPTGTREPAYSSATSDFWAQGFNFGLEYRF